MQIGRSTFLKLSMAAAVTAVPVAKVLAHCGACGSGAKKSGKAASPKAITLCGRCGEIKGSDKCCRAGATRCKCGMIKGSPGCCRMPKGCKDVVLCTKCGEIKGSDKCCLPGATRCSCGAIKGSPGCRIGCAAKKCTAKK
jgi:hypothetical protein